ncbi:MAG: exodeoxyribonuclease VII small subunit [Planctomycetota bacterium]|nr:exodeoxyribonuclease VII small subunit [Planctomycetota bacterium]MEC8413235.1 exodeoxyribonuclease VII small subunit [Planctomycetota bacterium]MEC8770032.1 exodeoxyribonuclease VII small subunit [Planctomycetota bacterium]MEC8855442.1 exodeoxyribonuclease VII small subunit [Planctomycetota bacterium]MEE2660614.1 exodeoxyribonuclease VII small subunit [Planctomycetota bacterium]
MAKSLPDPKKLTYEEALEALESIVERAESGELPLEEAMAEHARGEALLQRCRTLLEGAEGQLRSFDQPANDASDEDSA